MEQYGLSSQPSFHPSFRNDVRGPIVGSLRVHGPQLLIALSDPLHTPQLVAQAFTLLGQNVNISDCLAPDRTRRAAVDGEVQPGQRGVGLKVLFAHSPLVQSEKNAWNK